MTKIVEALLIRYLSIAAWSSTFWFRAPSARAVSSLELWIRCRYLALAPMEAAPPRSRHGRCRH